MGIPVRFMNRIFSFPQGPVVFAKKFKAPVLPIFVVRNEDCIGNTICVGKHFYYEETGDKKHDLLVNAQKMATIMEEFIKAHPADWMWFQHLFWTEPWSIEMYCRMTDEEKRKLSTEYLCGKSGGRQYMKNIKIYYWCSTHGLDHLRSVHTF